MASPGLYFPACSMGHLEHPPHRVLRSSPWPASEQWDLSWYGFQTVISTIVFQQLLTWVLFPPRELEAPETHSYSSRLGQGPFPGEGPSESSLNDEKWGPFRKRC